MNTIHNIRDFENLLFEKVDEFLQQQDCFHHPVLAIWQADDQLFVEVDDPESLSLPRGAATYDIIQCLRANDETGIAEPDVDFLNTLANEWLPLNH